MSSKTKGVDFTVKISDAHLRTDEHYIYEVPFQRWLVSEIAEGRSSVSQAIALLSIPVVALN